MEITIRHTEGCPNVPTAEERIREALRLAGKEAPLTTELVATQEEAVRLGFVGSPSILFDGHDPFADASTAPSLACRLYETERGQEHSPSVTQLRRIIEGR